jgi:hypothetical protein
MEVYTLCSFLKKLSNEYSEKTTVTLVPKGQTSVVVSRTNYDTSFAVDHLDSTGRPARLERIPMTDVFGRLVGYDYFEDVLYLEDDK